MKDLHKAVLYLILQAVKHACCKLIEEENRIIISGMPEHLRADAPVQITLHNRDNSIVQLWFAATAAQQNL